MINILNIIRKFKANFLFIFMVGLGIGAFGLLSQADAAKVRVPSNLLTDTLILEPQVPSFTPPCPCDASAEGRIIYNNKGDDNKLYVCDGSNWKLFGTDTTIGTRIVSAWNSEGSINASGKPCLGDGSDCYNPKADLGLTCNGTDDQDVIQKGINQMSSPGALYLLEGTYNFSGQGCGQAGICLYNNATRSDNQKAIIGSGAGTVFSLPADFNIPIYALIRATNVNGILISQIMMTGADMIANATMIGIDFNNVSDSKIDKVWITDINGQTWYSGAIRLRASDSNIISNSKIWDGDWYGIHLDNSTNNLVLNNIVEKGGGLGNIFINNTSDYNIISGNQVTAIGGGDGIMIRGSSYNNVANNYVNGGAYNGVSAGIHVTNENVGGVDINSTGNIVAKNHVSSIYNAGISSGGFCNIIAENNIVNCGLSPSNPGVGISAGGSSNLVFGNVIGNSGSHGISISGVQNIIANRIYDDTDATHYGIYIPFNSGGTVYDTYLAGNLISGAYADRLIYDNTGAFYTDKAKISLDQPRIPAVCKPASGGTINPQTSYMPLDPSSVMTLSAVTAIADGQALGDLLVLENVASNDISIPNGANVRLSAATVTLGKSDTLTLIWSGNVTAGYSGWLEIANSDN